MTFIFGWILVTIDFFIILSLLFQKIELSLVFRFLLSGIIGGTLVYLFRRAILKVIAYGYRVLVSFLITFLFSGVLFGVFFAHQKEEILSGSFPLILLVFLVSVFFISKGKKGVIITCVVLLVTGIAYSIVYRYRIRALITEAYDQLTAERIPTTVHEVFPLHSTGTMCQAYSDAVSRIFNRLTIPVKEKVVNIERTFVRAMTTGEDILALIQRIDGSSLSDWKGITQALEQLPSHISSCPYLQLVEPSEYENHPWDIPVPKLLQYVWVGRLFAVQALIEANEGSYTRAYENVRMIFEIAGKFKTPGQALITNLIAVSLSRKAVQTLVLVQTIEGKRVPGDFHRWIQKYVEKQEHTWFPTVMDADAFLLLKTYSILPFKMIEMHPKEYFPGISVIYRFYAPILMYTFAQKDLQSFIPAYVWYRKEIDFKKNRFQWRQSKHRYALREGGPFSAEFLSVYGRILRYIAEYRIAQVIGDIYRYAEHQGSYPDNLREISTELPLDPFTEKSFRYEKLNSCHFYIASAGGDLQFHASHELSKDEVFRVNAHEDIGFSIFRCLKDEDSKNK